VTTRTVVSTITLLCCFVLCRNVNAQAGGDIAAQIKQLQQESRDAQRKTTPHGRSSIWPTDSSPETAGATGRRGRTLYGTCSALAAEIVTGLGATPIDYRNSDFVQDIHLLTADGVDAVFDGIGGDNLWRSREALREGGRVVVYGFQAKLHGGRMASGAPSGRHPIRESAILGWYILRNRFLPGRKSMVPYSIQWLMRLKPAWFRHDLLTLFDLLQQKKIKPLIAERLPLLPSAARTRITGKRRRDW
jgi:NADPH:quinone reductase-like Zn-dependent oxidoreductase